MKRSRASDLWQPSFVLLWQGQLVSALGDAVYRIALGFWILDVAHSTALMGTLLAAPLVTRMVLSPWAGVLADRADRRWLLVGSDFASGVVVTLVGLAALADALQIWMVFVASVLVGASLSVLQPTIESALPDLVNARELGRANAAMAASSSGAAIAGNGAGGALFGLVGAPTLFLANGLSFMLSAASELFLRIPRPAPAPPHGATPAGSRGGGPTRGALGVAVRQLWAHRGVRALLLLTGLTHFASSAALVLLVPLFHARGTHGPRDFGLAMAGLGAGAFVGYSLGAVRRIAPEVRVRLFVALGMLEAGSLAVLPWLDATTAIVSATVGIGLAMAVGSTLVTTGLQLVVPSSMRGRTFGLRASWMLALTSAATLGAGLLAEWLTPSILVTAMATVMSLGFASTLLLRAAREVLRARPRPPMDP